MAIIQGAITTQPQDATNAVINAAQTGAVSPSMAPAPAPAAAPVPQPAPIATPASSVPPTTSAPAPAPGTVAQASQPSTWSVTPDQTVEGRIQSIIASGNPIIQQARTNALQTANSRGLLNSSMAVQAGEAAAYGAALPIAQADAATAAKSASYNVDQANQYGLKNLDVQSQYGLQQLQTENSKLLQTNNQAATAFNQALVAIADINKSTTMDANAKTQAIAQIQSQLQSQLKTLSATSGLNLNTQLNFATYPGFDSNGNFVGFPDSAPAGGASAGGGGAAPAPVSTQPTATASDPLAEQRWYAANGV